MLWIIRFSMNYSLPIFRGWVYANYANYANVCKWGSMNSAGEIVSKTTGHVTQNWRQFMQMKSRVAHGIIQLQWVNSLIPAWVGFSRMSLEGLPNPIGCFYWVTDLDVCVHCSSFYVAFFLWHCQNGAGGHRFPRLLPFALFLFSFFFHKYNFAPIATKMRFGPGPDAVPMRFPIFTYFNRWLHSVWFTQSTTPF